MPLVISYRRLTKYLENVSHKTEILLKEAMEWALVEKGWHERKGMTPMCSSPGFSQSRHCVTFLSQWRQMVIYTVTHTQFDKKSVCSWDANVGPCNLSRSNLKFQLNSNHLQSLSFPHLHGADIETSRRHSNLASVHSLDAFWRFQDLSKPT